MFLESNNREFDKIFILKNLANCGKIVYIIYISKSRQDFEDSDVKGGDIPRQLFFYS